MKNIKNGKTDYSKPAFKLLALGTQVQFLDTSPAVTPGGGGSEVVPPRDDNDDTDIVGAKHFNQWEND